jgi:hypothetical protein
LTVWGTEVAARTEARSTVYACVAVRPSNDHIRYMEDSKKRSKNRPVRPEGPPKPTGAPRRSAYLDELTERQAKEFEENLRRNSILKTPTN